MKQFLFAAMAAASLALSIGAGAQNQQSGATNPVSKEKTAKAKTAKEAVPASNMVGAPQVSMAYKPTYSAQFTMGNPAHSQMVLNLIKDYETNLFSMSSSFADTAVVIMPDGKMVQGVEALTSTFKQMRAGNLNLTINIAAVIPMRSTDRKENWVLVWGNSSNDNDRADFHHIWRINRDGKVDFLQLFQGKSPAQ